MTGDLETRLSAALHRRVDRLAARTPLAPGSYERARGLRRRRRLAAGAAYVALVAAAVPIGLRLLPDATPAVDPAGKGTTVQRTPSPSPDDRTTEDSTKLGFDLDKLSEKGAPPRVPWLLDKAIHDGERTTPIEGQGDIDFAPVEGGYVIAVDRPADEEKWRTEYLVIGEDGTKRSTLDATSFPIVSRDGKSIAWVRSGKAGSDTTEFVLADATGKARETVGVDHPEARLAGFVGPDIAFARGSEVDGVLGLWKTDTGDVTYVEKAGTPVNTDGQSLVAVETRTVRSEDDMEQTCTGVYDVAAGRLVHEEACTGYQPQRMLGDRYVLASSYETGTPAILDARTGQVLLELGETSLVSEMGTEPNGDLLLLAGKARDHDGGTSTMAIVRCTIGGECELATEKVEVTHEPVDSVAFSLPYLPDEVERLPDLGTD